MSEDNTEYHVLPNLSVRNQPEIWLSVIEMLIARGLERDEALTRVRFAYSGALDGPLPVGVR